MNPALDALCGPNGALHLEPPHGSEYEGGLLVDEGFLAELVAVTERVLAWFKAASTGEGM
jgi:hypothetical protein